MAHATTVRFDDEMLERLRQEAEASERSVTQQVRYYIRRGLTEDRRERERAAARDR